MFYFDVWYCDFKNIGNMCMVVVDGLIFLVIYNNFKDKFVFFEYLIDLINMNKLYNWIVFMIFYEFYR